MADPGKKPLRQIARPYVAGGPSGVSIRDRLKDLTAGDEEVLRLVGEHMGRLASVTWPAGAGTVWGTPPACGPPVSGT